MKEIMEQLEKMADIMGDVTRRWSELDSEDQDKLVEGYPFHKSFDEVVIDVENWIEKVKEKK